MKPKPKKAKHKIAKPAAVEPKTVVVIDEQEYHAGYPACRSCPHLSLNSQDWFCSYEPNTSNCVLPALRALYKGQ